MMIRTTIWRLSGLPIVLCLLSPQVVAQSYTFDWLTSAGGSDNESVSGLDVASDGTIAITGYFEDPAVFGGTTLPGDGVSAEMYVAKLDSAGNFLWARGATGRGYDEGQDVAVDDAGNIWVSGYFAQTTVFDPTTTLTSTGWSDIFVAKYSPDGTLLFVQQFGNDEVYRDSGESIGTDRVGNAYVAISFKESLTIAGTTMTAPDIFHNSAIVKLAPDGTPIWAVHARSHDSLIRNISVDSSGNVAIVGSFEQTLSLGSATLRSAGLSDAFAARLAPDGSVIWASSTGSGWYEEGYAITQDGSDVLVAGIADRNATIFGVPVRNTLGRGLFLARLDSAGRTRWVRSAEADYSLVVRDVAVERDGDVVLVGNFRYIFRAGTTTLTGPPMRTAGFLVRLTGLGEIRGVDRISSAPDNTNINAVISPTVDRLVLAGRYGGTLALDGNSVTSRGAEDAWIAGGAPRIIPPEHDPYGDGVTDLGTLGEHIHWRCTELVRRVLGDPYRSCPGVFEHGPAPSGAEDIFSRTIRHATLSRPNEVDQFQFALPDITDSDHGDEHADIRPEASPYRDDEPEPLEECHAVQRLVPGPPGRTAIERDTIWVTTAGQLSVRVFPTVNDRGEQPVSLTNERLKLYSGRRLLDEIAVSSRSASIITCPMDIHDLSDIRVTFGEREPRDGPRELAEMGGYRLEIEYRIDARRGIPDWALDEFDIRNLGAFAPAGCTPGPFGSFPDCVPGFVGRFETPHPRLPQPDCLADGPGCWELSWFEWADELERLELTLDLPPGMEIRILNDQGQAMASATSGTFPNEPQRRELVELEADLDPGLYFLAVNGPPANIGITVGIAEAGQSIAPPPRFGGLSVLQLGLLALAMFFLGMFVFRAMQRR